jgi:hypothetical protein
MYSRLLQGLDFAGTNTSRQLRRSLHVAVARSRAPCDARLSAICYDATCANGLAGSPAARRFFAADSKSPPPGSAPKSSGGGSGGGGSGGGGGGGSKKKKEAAIRYIDPMAGYKHKYGAQDRPPTSLLRAEALKARAAKAVAAGEGGLDPHDETLQALVEALGPLADKMSKSGELPSAPIPPPQTFETLEARADHDLTQRMVPLMEASRGGMRGMGLAGRAARRAATMPHCLPASSARRSQMTSARTCV